MRLNDIEIVLVENKFSYETNLKRKGAILPYSFCNIAEIFSGSLGLRNSL